MKNYIYVATLIDGKGWDKGPGGADECLWANSEEDRIFATAQEAWAFIYDIRNAGCWSYEDNDGNTHTDIPAITKTKITEWEKRFDLYYDALMRGTEAWRKANPGNDLVMPDTAKLMEWMVGEVFRLTTPGEDEFTSYEETLRDEILSAIEATERAARGRAIGEERRRCLGWAAGSAHTAQYVVDAIEAGIPFDSVDVENEARSLLAARPCASETKDA